MSSILFPRLQPFARDCPDCGFQMPISRTTCPHCGRPSFFPNVDLAKLPGEQTKLKSRYDCAVVESINRGCDAIAGDFETACSRSSAAFACGIEKLQRAIATGVEIFESFYDLERLRLRFTKPVVYDFATLRVQAETELLGSHHHVANGALHYACLTVDRKGLESYGECLVQLAEPMIAHRASCFEGNTAVLYAEGHDFSDCLRSTWSDRGMLCLAIFACHLNASFTSSDFPAIVVKDGVTGIDDRFIEVHIFGPMTLRTFEAIQIDEAKFSSQQKILSEMVQAKAVGIVTVK